MGESVTVAVRVHYPDTTRAQTDVTLRSFDTSILGVGEGAIDSDRYLWPIPDPVASQEESFEFNCLSEGTTVVEVSVARSERPSAKLLVECTNSPAAVSIVDSLGDLIDSISGRSATRSDPHVDLVGVQAATVDASVVEESFPCSDADVTCGGGTATGPMAHFISVVAEEVPEEVDHHVVYSVVARVTEDTADDWVPQGGFDWDTYQAADHWWHYTIDVASGRTLGATAVAVDQSVSPVDTAARATIQGGRVELFVPWVELGDRDSVEFRVTTFAAGDSSYPEDDRGGDVPGANPTEPMLTLTR